MDWVATGITIVGSILLARKRRFGWITMIIASLFWMAYAVFTVHSIPIVVLNVILIANAVQGFRNW